MCGKTVEHVHMLGLPQQRQAIALPMDIDQQSGRTRQRAGSGSASVYSGSAPTGS